MEGDEVRRLVQRALGLEFVYPFFVDGCNSEHSATSDANLSSDSSTKTKASESANTANSTLTLQNTLQNENHTGTFVRCMVPPVPEKSDLAHRLLNDTTTCSEFVVQVLPKSSISRAIMRPEEQPTVSQSQMQGIRNADGNTETYV
jgi:hypothetical protein